MGGNFVYQLIAHCLIPKDDWYDHIFVEISLEVMSTKDMTRQQRMTSKEQLYFIQN